MTFYVRAALTLSTIVVCASLEINYHHRPSYECAVWCVLLVAVLPSCVGTHVIFLHLPRAFRPRAPQYPAVTNLLAVDNQYFCSLARSRTFHWETVREVIELKCVICGFIFMCNGVGTLL